MNSEHPKRTILHKTVVSKRTILHKIGVSKRTILHKTGVSERTILHKTEVSERTILHKTEVSERTILQFPTLNNKTFHNFGTYCISNQELQFPATNLSNHNDASPCAHAQIISKQNRKRHSCGYISIYFAVKKYKYYICKHSIFNKTIHL